MTQGLLLDGIDLQRRGRPIPQAIKPPTLIHPYEAKPSLSRINMTMPRTKVTMHPPASLSLPPAALIQSFRLLKDLQVLHRPSSQASISPQQPEHDEMKLKKHQGSGSLVVS